MASQGNDSSSLGQKIACFLTTAVLLFCFFFFHTFYWFPDYPYPEIMKFSVSGFNDSYPGFTAKWEADVRTSNENIFTTCHFDEVQVLLYYDKDYYNLGSTFIQPFSLGGTKSKTMHVGILANDAALGKMGKWAVDKMVAERRANGTVSFNLRLSYKVAIGLGSWEISSLSSNYDCRGIKVIMGDTVGGEAAREALGHCV